MPRPRAVAFFLFLFLALVSLALAASPSPYDTAILADSPVGYWPLNGNALDLSPNKRNGTLTSGTPGLSTMPNSDPVYVFSGLGEYIAIATSTDFSIPTTKMLTWEGWIRPDVLQFNVSTGGYVTWMGKCEQYSPTCEWEARMYNQVNSQSRISRLSSYAFNPTASLGSGADFQAVNGTIVAGMWLHIVAQYQTRTTPSRCNVSYPGTIEIFVNGVQWNSSYHGTTGCMSQYFVIPQAKTSRFLIGTMAFDSYFQGAIGKVAIYNYLLNSSQIRAHYTAMMGIAPSGSCVSECTIPTLLPSPATAPSPSLSPSPTPTPNPTPTPTPTPNPMPTPTRTSTPTRVPSPSPTPNLTPSLAPTFDPSPSPMLTTTPGPSPSPLPPSTPPPSAPSPSSDAVPSFPSPFNPSPSSVDQSPSFPSSSPSDSVPSLPSSTTPSSEASPSLAYPTSQSLPSSAQAPTSISVIPSKVPSSPVPPTQGPTFSTATFSSAPFPCFVLFAFIASRVV